MAGAAPRRLELGKGAAQEALLVRMIVCRFGHVQARSSGDDLSRIVVASWSQGQYFRVGETDEGPEPEPHSKKKYRPRASARVQAPTNYVPVSLE